MSTGEFGDEPLPGTKVGILSKATEEGGIRTIFTAGYAVFEGYFAQGDLEATEPMTPDVRILHTMRTGVAPMPRLRCEDGTVLWGNEVFWMLVGELQRLRALCDKEFVQDPKDLRSELDRQKNDLIEFQDAAKLINTDLLRVSGGLSVGLIPEAPSTNEPCLN